MSKSENKKYIIWAILAALALYFYRVFNAAQKLTFNVGSISKFSLKGGVVSWIQNIKVTNGDFVPIPIRSVSVQNYFGSSYIGTSILDSPTLIAGSSTTDLPLQVKISYADLIKAGLEIFSIGKKVSISFKGEVNSIGVSIPLNETFLIDFSKK
jgi:LEA14-like dessication related protein